MLEKINNNPLKLLFIEDDPAVMEMYGHGFKLANFDLAMATEGQEGVDLALKIQPDLVVTDILMEGKDGFYVIEQLEKNKKTKNIPVIALSNLGNNEDKDEALRLGAKAFLVKSEHTPAELNKKLSQILAELRNT